MAKKSKAVHEDNISNDAKDVIEMSSPYCVEVEIQGSSDFLFHKWSCEDVDEKAKASKGSAQKKSDNIESYVYRTKDGDLAIPGEYLRQACIHASKFRQDPRSPRKSLMDLAKAAIVVLTPLSSLGCKTWDYEDKRRVVIQRNSINRTRPAMNAGWKVKFILQVLLPEYINPTILNDLIITAGKLIGIGDFRPSYGRFQVTEFKVIES